MRPFLLACVLLLAGCGDTAVTTTDAPAAPAAITAVPTTTAAPTTDAPASTIDEGAQEAAAAFLAAVDAQLVDTAYADQAFEAPEVFLATGRLFCERLDAGDDADQILTDYVAELSDASIDEAADDDLVLAGALLGAGVGTLCPEHEDALSG